MTPIEAVLAELRRARHLYPAFHSAHEGYATLLEECDELWDCVRMKQSDPDRRIRMRQEAIQVAAMALRFIEDCCDRETEA
jgi:hypothetical protein